MFKILRLFLLFFVLVAGQGCVSLALKDTLYVDKNEPTGYKKLWQQGEEIHVKVRYRDGQYAHKKFALSSCQPDLILDPMVRKKDALTSEVDVFPEDVSVEVATQKLSPARTGRRNLKLKWHESISSVFERDTIGLYVFDENNKKLGYFNFRRGRDKILGPVIDTVFLCEILPLHGLSYAHRTLGFFSR